MFFYQTKLLAFVPFWNFWVKRWTGNDDHIKKGGRCDYANQVDDYANQVDSLGANFRIIATDINTDRKWCIYEII